LDPTVKNWAVLRMGSDKPELVGWSSAELTARKMSERLAKQFPGVRYAVLEYLYSVQVPDYDPPVQWTIPVKPDDEAQAPDGAADGMQFTQSVGLDAPGIVNASPHYLSMEDIRKSVGLPPRFGPNSDE
jgi:hypothetical protein